MTTLLRTLIFLAASTVTFCLYTHGGGGPKGLFHPGPTPRHFVGPMPGRPAVGDLNGDRKLDIVVACGPCCGSPESPASGHLFVLLGQGGGEFKPYGGPIKIGPSVRKVALGDMNGDGRLDAVVVEHNTYATTVMLGDGKGGFTKAPGSPVQCGAGPRAHVHEVVIADVNGDGRADVLTTNPNDHAVGVLLGNGKGGIAPAPGSPFVVARHPYDALVAKDMNGDGKLDLVVPDLTDNSVRVLFGDGRGSYLRERCAVVKVGDRPGYVVTGDINGDGYADICATHDDIPMVDLILGDGRGGFAPAPNSPLKLNMGKFVWGTVLRDVTGDKKLDLLMGIAGGKGVVVMIGDGKGGFVPAPGSPFPAEDSSDQLAVGDFNDDGRPDIVTGNYAAGTLSVLLNQGH